jgi:multidrug resistance efflux pump
MNKMKSFVKEVVAVLQGDNAEATGQKILRQADSALKAAIAVAKGDTLGLEDQVETANEQLALAKINRGELITDRNAYVQNLIIAKNNVIDAEEVLHQHLEQLAFFEEQLALLDK